MKNIYWAGIMVLTLLFSRTVVAGEPETGIISPASIELLKAKSLWFNTTNSAGLTLDRMADFNSLLFNVSLKNGDFKKNSDGADERIFGVSTEGGLNLGSGYVWGKFAYNNEKQTGTLYNTTMLDPSGGMPYFPVDKNLSDWVKQDYNLSMKAATKPLWERVYLGVEARYVTKTGSKQVDPRSTTDFYTLSVQPGLTLSFGKHAAGINFLYEKLNQESGTTNSNSQANQDVFVMKGLGNFYSAVVGGLQSLGKFVYDGNKAGGAVQYAFNSESARLLINGKYSFGVEDVISSPSKPKKEGTIKENDYQANLQLLFSGNNLNKIELGYTNNSRGGIEYVQVLDNTFAVQRWITTYKSIRSTYDFSDLVLKYDFFRGNDSEYKWRAGLSVNYRNSEDVYIIPASEMNSEDLIFGANAKINMKLKNAGNILAGASFSYKTNMSGDYVYGGADPSSPIITDYMNPDFQYLMMDYMKIGGDISYFTTLITRNGKNRRSGLFVKAALDYCKPTDGSDFRMMSNFGVGFTF